MHIALRCRSRFAVDRLKSSQLQFHTTCVSALERGGHFRRGLRDPAGHVAGAGRPFRHQAAQRGRRAGLSTISTAVLAESGADMSIFASAKHLTSWAGLAPATTKVQQTQARPSWQPLAAHHSGPNRLGWFRAPSGLPGAPPLLVSPEPPARQKSRARRRAKDLALHLPQTCPSKPKTLSGQTQELPGNAGPLFHYPGFGGRSSPPRPLTSISGRTFRVTRVSQQDKPCRWQGVDPGDPK
jgi:hypothetical protein